MNGIFCRRGAAKITSKMSVAKVNTSWANTTATMEGGKHSSVFESYLQGLSALCRTPAVTDSAWLNQCYISMNWESKKNRWSQTHLPSVGPSAYSASSLMFLTSYQIHWCSLKRLTSWVGTLYIRYLILITQDFICLKRDQVTIWSKQHSPWIEIDWVLP